MYTITNSGLYTTHRFFESTDNSLSYTGKVKLDKVLLKSSAFDELGLPITVVKGSIDVIDFDIPWKSIQSSPVVITIKGLKAVLGPNTVEQGAYFDMFADVRTVIFYCLIFRWGYCSTKACDGAQKEPELRHRGTKKGAHKTGEGSFLCYTAAYQHPQQPRH